MPRLIELIEDGVPAKLEHPVVGYVRWSGDKMGGGFCLRFGRGPEKFRPLVADHTVLFCDKWIKTS
jgi:hypothetical protein